MVRVWKEDPRLDEYFQIEWPTEFELFVGDLKGAGETLQHMWTLLPNEPSYGFIGDDCVLRTEGGIDELERQAGDWFIAYPSDTLQRNRLPTHFCVGGKLTNALGWLVPNGIKHGYMDLPWLNLGINTGLMRYCPHVVFQHKHFLLGEAEYDASYQEMYSASGELLDAAEHVMADKARLDDYLERHFRADILKVNRAVVREFEDPNAWAREDAELCNA